FSLAKVFKLRCECKKTNRVLVLFKKNHNFIFIQARRTKINIQVFPYLLNNFTYAPFACLVCLAKVFKLCCEGKKINRVLVLFKKNHNSMFIQARCTKINIQVFPYLLNNFTYAPFACLVWPKCLNYIMKVKNKLRSL